MKYIEPRPFADPEAAARKLMEIGNTTDAVQDGRVHIEKIISKQTGTTPKMACAKGPPRA